MTIDTKLTFTTSLEEDNTLNRAYFIIEELYKKCEECEIEGLYDEEYDKIVEVKKLAIALEVLDSATRVLTY